MKYGLSEEQLKTLRAFLAKEPSIEQAILFGSRAMGSYKEASDIDLAIKGKEFDIFNANSLKNRLEEETTIPFFFDIVAYDGIQSEELKEHICNEGVVVYNKGMEEWKATTLGAITNKIGSGATPRGGSNAYYTMGISLIRSQNVLDFSFSHNGLAYINEEQAYELKNVTVEKNDILLNITGDSVARCCKVPNDIWPARVNQHVAIIRAHPKKADNNFIFYLLQLKKEELLSHSEIGATRRALTKGMLENLEILIPSVCEQRKIAAILSTLDDKIDLLHRQNRTLEAMAETLFRQWFMEDEEESWEAKSLLDVIELVGGGTPKTSVPEYWDGKIPWLSGGDIASSHKSFVVSSEKSISQNGLDKCSAKLLPKFATVISARGTVGKYSILSEPMAYSQSNYGILPKVDGCFFFTYLLINHVVSELCSSAYGSVFDTITTATFKDIAVTIPSEDIIKIFESNIKNYFLKKLHCLKQIQTLEKLRDTLLSKLMNGEVRVDYAR